MSITERLRARKVANMIPVDGETPRIRGQLPDALCIEAADEIDRLSADLREEQDRRQAMRNEWSAEVAALTERVNALRDDRDCEKRLRKDAEEAREAATAIVASLTAERDFAMSHWASAATAYENLSRKTGEEA